MVWVSDGTEIKSNFVNTEINMPQKGETCYVFLNFTWIDARTQNSANWETVKNVDLVIFHKKMVLVKLSVLHHGDEVFSNFFSTNVFRWKIIKEG